MTTFLSSQQQNLVPASVIISRFTNAEYALLMQKRAAAVTAGGAALAMVKQWDIATTAGVIDTLSPAAQTFAAALVTAGVLTQARATAIFQ